MIKEKIRPLKMILIGGLFFLVPFATLIIIGGKIFIILMKIVEPLASFFPVPGLLAEHKSYAMAVMLLLVVCYLAGLLSRTARAKKAVTWLEDGLLNQIPGYAFMKQTSAHLAGSEQEKSYNVVLARIEDAWQLAFLIERIDENNLAVCVPGAPSPWAGNLFFMTPDRIRDIDLSYKQALDCIRGLGTGSGRLLKGKL
jgi:uncharacterized membrane protein